MGLSSRESEIMLLLSEGWSSKAIADRLGISKATVDTHRRNLLRKTASKNTNELIAKHQPPEGRTGEITDK